MTKELVCRLEVLQPQPSLQARKFGLQARSFMVCRLDGLQARSFTTPAKQLVCERLDAT